MGQVRRLPFDAVIGIGGISGQPTSQGIAGKINWIGIGARTKLYDGLRGPLVKFDHFLLFEEKGREFEEIAPNLARRLYRRGAARFVFNKLNQVEREEISRILKIAKDAPASAGSWRCKSMIEERLHRRAHCPSKSC